MLDRELKGILVVSLEQAVAAPYCGLLLADAGARVIKVERPEGDFARGYDKGAGGESAIFAWLNRGKEAIALDLKTDSDLSLMRDMLAKADVFVSNLAPGAVDRMGLSGKALREANPGLITCQVTGYGKDGDAAKKKAYDFLVQGEAGLLDVTGSPDAPARVGVSITDLSTGLTAFSAILRALIQRGRTGKGIDIDLSMFDVLADWMNMPLMQHRYAGGAPGRTGMQHSFVAPYGAFTCKGGDQVLLSIQSDREWAVFCEQVLGHPELISDPRFAQNADRYANRTVLDGIVNAAFGDLERGDVIAKLDAARIANSQLNTVADLSEHAFLSENSAVIAGFDLRMAGLPVAGVQATDVPAIDQQGAALRREFGGGRFSPDQPRLRETD